MILPLALVGMLLATTLAAGIQLAAWRAQRGAQSQWDAQRATYAADAAIVRTIAGLTADSAVAAPIGARVARPDDRSDGWLVQTSLTRTAPLALLARAVARREPPAIATPGAPGTATHIRRTVTRIINLDVPALPIKAALTVLGHLTVSEPVLDGRDRLALYDPARDDCGPHRDTTSLPALADAGRLELAPPILFGHTRSLSTATVHDSRTRFDTAIAQLRPHLVSITPATDSTIPAAPAWQPIITTPSGAITLDGTSHHVGLLVVDGDLLVRGTLHIDGLLLINGALDVTAGTLHVNGAALVRDRHTLGTTITADTRITYAPCLLARALGAAGRVSIGRFALWNSP